MTPEVFTEFADAIALAIRSVEQKIASHPEIAFPGLAAIREAAAKHQPTDILRRSGEAVATSIATHHVLVGVARAVGKAPHEIDALFDDLLAGLEADSDGAARFVRDHGLGVEAEFARAFNASAIKHAFAPILDSFVRVAPAAQPDDPKPDAPAKKAKKSNGQAESAEPQD